MSQLFDLFGDPVPDNWGGRGRPQHIATQENRNKVSMLLALGWNSDRIASALLITPKTLRKNYSREMKFRREARDRLDARLAMVLWKEAEGGSVAAIREFRSLVDKNDVMAGHRSFYGTVEEKPEREERLGKKEEAARAAENAGGADTPWGDDLRPQGNPIQ